MRRVSSPHFYYMAILQRYILVLSLLLSLTGLSQDLIFSNAVSFRSHPEQTFGMDSPQEHLWNNLYETIYLEDSLTYQVPIKSIGSNETDVVSVHLTNPIANNKLYFKAEDLDLELIYVKDNDSTLTLQIPPAEHDHYINAYVDDRLIGKLLVKVYKPITQDVYIITTTEKEVEIDSVSAYMNKIFVQANIRFHMIDGIEYPLNKALDIERFSNPSSAHDRYTEEMKALRDQFFIDHPDLYKSAFLVFIVPGFVDPFVEGYMVKNKAMAFIKEAEDNSMYHEISRQLAFGIGILEHSWNADTPEAGTTQNLMDTLGGSELVFEQWQKLRHCSNSYSFYDGDEDVRTNNGLVGYYYWEEDAEGNIIYDQEILDGIKRPYKKNYLSYHLNIRDFMFESIYERGTIRICWWHLAGWFALLVIGIIIKVKFKIRKRLKSRSFLVSLVIKWTLRSILALACFGFYIFTNQQLVKYEVNSGLLKEFKGESYQEIKKSVLNNEFLRKKDQEELSSEIFVNKDGNWYMKRRERVLYFSSIYDSTDYSTKTKFTVSMDSLILKRFNYKEIAESHYAVFTTYNLDGKMIDQKAYNHLGIEISSKLKVKDAAKRILLFVNGYRPTSVGHSFEENFNDVLSNGLEYPNSSNHIYSFDRYNYWRPWNEIDLKFIRKLNPAETYYADGHFSVETSNHESIVNFTKASTHYPKRCSDQNNHTCEYYSKSHKSLELLPLKPNKKGFKERRNNGKIAAKNLDMMFNELPNVSDNDTLYIVAHSMGYAYSLGIIDELRGKINFGGIYIIAPENASGGKINRNEWTEVWQYGSNLEKGQEEAPCLQDGIAPQSSVKGLTEDYRAYIPEDLYKRKGFFESHFIGYYSWIFKLEPDQKGFIRQR